MTDLRSTGVTGSLPVIAALAAAISWWAAPAWVRARRDTRGKHGYDGIRIRQQRAEGGANAPPSAVLASGPAAG